MLSIPDIYKEKIINELISNRLKILFPDQDEETITDVNIESESMCLKQAISDEDKLKFGGCISSEFSVTLINTVDRAFDNSLVGKWIQVVLWQAFPSGTALLPRKDIFPSDDILSGETTANKGWYLFNGIVKSADVDKNDSNKRKIVAYDLFSGLYDIEASNDLFALWKSNKSGVPLSTLIELVVSKILTICNDFHDCITSDKILSERINAAENLKVKDLLLYNDVWMNNSDKLSYGLLLKYICEMLGVFAFIQPCDFKGGRIKYVTFGANAEEYDFYEKLNECEINPNPYTGVMFSIGGTNRTAKNLMFGIDSDEHLYDLRDNILVWQNNDNAGGAYIHKFNDLFVHKSGTRILNSYYLPVEVTTDGRLWVEVGDKIKVKTYVTDAEGSYIYNDDGTVKTKIIESYVLSREITGIQALTDKIIAKGA